MRITWRGLILFLLSVWLFFQLLKTTSRRKKMNTINDIGNQVFNLLKAEGFNPDTAKYITAQAAHETGNFTSKIFKENNNLFGMKLPKQRKTTATGEKYGHATFNNIEDAVKDFKLYYKTLGYMGIYPSLAAYVKALVKRGYFEASPEEYESGMKYFYNLYFVYGG